MQERWQEYRDGTISFAECDASVQGWNHVCYANTWGLRREVLDQLLLKRKKLLQCTTRAVSGR